MSEEVKGISYDGKLLIPNEKLPEGTNGNRQLAVLGHLIFDKAFFMTAHRRIRPDWFSNARLSKIYRFLLELQKETSSHPTMVQLKNASAFMLELPEERRQLFNLIDEASKWRLLLPVDHLKRELTDWMHAKIFQEAMTKAAKEWNAKNNSKVAKIMEEATREFRDSTFEPAIEMDFGNPQEWIKAEENNETEALTTGCYLLDRALLKRKENDATDARVGDVPKSKGLQLGDTTVILAPSNTGKTSTLITIARHNIVAGKHVLFMTHEGRPEDIRNKFYRAFLGVTQDDLFALYKTPEGQRELERAANAFRNNLKYVPYNKAGMTVEEVIPVIRAEQENWGAKHGKGFDLLVSDYPAKLSTDKAEHGHMSPRHIQDLVYEYYVQLGLEYKFHSLLAIQTNREGSRVNSGNHSGNYGKQAEGKDHRLLGMEDVAEAWGPMTSASNVITLNRSPEAKRQKRMTYFVAKSRSSDTGMAIVTETRFEHSLTHFRSGKSTCYAGTRTLEGTINDRLQDFNGAELPHQVLLEDSK